MRIGTGMEWAIHCCTVLGALPEGHVLPAQKLAEFHGVPQPYLTKHLQALVRGGVIESVSGPRGGYRLARSADDVSLLDIVIAVDGDGRAFECTEIRQRGPGAGRPRDYRGPCGIASAMWAAEQAYRDSLAEVTVASLNRQVLAAAPPHQLVESATWLRDAITNRARGARP